MQETLRQLGGLLLGSVPTVIMLVLLYAIYTFLVHRPLAKVLAERRAKTEGAIEKASADVAAAEAKTAEYEQRLREARVAVFRTAGSPPAGPALQARGRQWRRPGAGLRSRSSRLGKPSSKPRLPPRRPFRRNRAGWLPKSFARCFARCRLEAQGAGPDETETRFHDTGARSGPTTLFIMVMVMLVVGVALAQEPRKRSRDRVAKSSGAAVLRTATSRARAHT